MRSSVTRNSSPSCSTSTCPSSAAEQAHVAAQRPVRLSCCGCVVRALCGEWSTAIARVLCRARVRAGRSARGLRAAPRGGASRRASATSSDGARPERQQLLDHHHEPGELLVSQCAGAGVRRDRAARGASRSTSLRIWPKANSAPANASRAPVESARRPAGSTSCVQTRKPDRDERGVLDDVHRLVREREVVGGRHVPDRVDARPTPRARTTAARAIPAARAQRRAARHRPRRERPGR